MQTIYTHGTVLQVENSEQLLEFSNFGWGAQTTFVKPRRGGDPQIPDAFEEAGPGSWFHLPLTSIPNSVRFSYPYLTSVFLLFQTDRCRISDLHVDDGSAVIDQVHFPTDSLHVPGGLHGSIGAPFRHDLMRPYRMKYAIGLSFFAFSYYGYFEHHNPDRAERGILVVGAGGAQYDLELSVFTGGVSGTVVEGP